MDVKMANSGNANIKSAVFAGLILLTVVAGTAPAVLTWLVDPYEYFRTGAHDNKLNETAEKAHYPLWKFAHYKRDAEIVVLGDSRARALRDKYWAEYRAAPAYNFAYGGGTIPEIYSTFQAIRNDDKVKTLVVGVQLRSFDEAHKGGLNRVPEAVKTTANAIAYLKNWFVARQSWRVVEHNHPKMVAVAKNTIPEFVGKAFAADLGKPGRTDVGTLLKPDVCFGCEVPHGGQMIEPPASKGLNLGLGRGDGEHVSAILALRLTQPLPPKFERQVRKNAASDWKGFRFSQRYMDMITEMSRWADERADRHLIFVIPPTIVDMQNTIARYGLETTNTAFRNQLAALAPVVDFDFPSELTADIRNFSDAYHFNSIIARQIVGEIMTAQGTNEEQAKKVSKKRGALQCPSLKQVASMISTAPFVQGKACRVWKRRNNG